MTDNIVELLEQWGNWSRSGLDNLGCKSNMESIMHKAPLIDVTTCRQYRSVSMLNDDDAMRVDKIISELAKKDLKARNCLFLKYVLKISDEDIAHGYLTLLKYGKDSKRKVSKHIAKSVISEARGTVRGWVMNETARNLVEKYRYDYS